MIVPCDPKGKEYTEADDKFVENPDDLVGRNIDFKVKIINARGLPSRFTVSYKLLFFFFHYLKRYFCLVFY